MLPWQQFLICKYLLLMAFIFLFRAHITHTWNIFSTQTVLKTNVAMATSAYSEIVLLIIECHFIHASYCSCLQYNATQSLHFFPFKPILLPWQQFVIYKHCYIIKCHCTHAPNCHACNTYMYTQSTY